MLPTPRLSICIPVRNGERYLHAALASVFTQNPGNFEVIVCNDRSTDGTAAVLASTRDPRLRVVQTTTTSGVGAARNACLALVRGQYVAWLDADDELLPGSLARQAAVLDQHPNVGLVHGAFDVVDEDGVELPPWPVPFSTDTILPSDVAFSELLLSNYIVTASAVMARTHLLGQGGGFEEGLAIGEDWDMWLRLSLASDVAYLSSPVARYRRHASSLTARPRRSEARLLADAAVVRRAGAHARLVGFDPSIVARARAALGAKAILALGEALTRGSRTHAIGAALLARRLAGSLVPLGDTLHLARDLLLGREYEVYVRSRSLVSRLQKPLATTVFGRSLAGKASGDPAWELELRAIARVVSEVVPHRAMVLAVDKWDPTLLHLTGRRGIHFPDRRLLPDGYPRDSAEAIDHLERLRKRRGADYLIFPRAAFWWLDFYAGLRGYLDERHERIWEADSCVIYRLGASA